MNKKLKTNAVINVNHSKRAKNNCLIYVQNKERKTNMLNRNKRKQLSYKSVN